MIGAGSAGTALAASLAAAGRPVGLVGRWSIDADRAAALGAAWLGTFDAPGSGFEAAGVVVLAVRDEQIEATAASLAGRFPWTGRVALHLSGSLPSSVLSVLAARGASIGSCHPLIALKAAPGRPPGVPGGTPFFGEGAPDALEAARGIAEAVGGTFTVLASSERALYHAAATLAGNLVAVLHAAGADVLTALGVVQAQRALLPLARQALQSVVAHDGIGGLTGPLARGDADTLRANVEALRQASPALRRAHAATSLLALEMLESAGHSPPQRDAMESLLRAVLEELR